MARRDQMGYTESENLNEQSETARRRTAKGKGSKPEAPRGRKGQTSGRGSSGAKKSANRPGPSGTGKKTGIRNSSGRRRSGSRSGGGQGQKKK